MANAEKLPLILGGHSFISQLGLEPRPKAAAAAELVQSCLDSGITTFDTTYQPERIALGAALTSLGRNSEAKVIAWNFFEDFDDTQPVGGPREFNSDDINIMQDQLRRDFIDCLTVHSVGCPVADERQQSLCCQWVADGLVGRLGLWSPGDRPQDRYPGGNPYSYVIHPGNIFRDDADGVFAASAAMGWRCISCSPFIRGWKLNEMTQLTIKKQWVAQEDAKNFTANLMLRHCLYRPEVEACIVAMREPKWIAQNAKAAADGPLNETELLQLQELKDDLHKSAPAAEI